MTSGNGSTVKKAAVSNGPEPTRKVVSYVPRVDIYETPEEYVLACDVPGVQMNDLDARFDKGELIVHGKVTPREAPRGYAVNEYGIGDFYRSFAFGEDVDPSKLMARYAQGVLTVRLPKKEGLRPRKITIKAQ